MDIQKTLEWLCTVSGPSGFEHAVCSAGMELLRPLMDEVFLTRLGSVVGVRRCGKPNARRLLFDAHLDEVGVIVTGEKDGYLRFRCLGGVDPRMLCDREITLLTDPPVFCVAACLPPHIQSREDMDKSIPVEDIYLDAGLSVEQVKQRIPIGTPGVFRGGLTVLGETQLCGKALDDRACMVAILRALELLSATTCDMDLYVLFSTQEEVGGAGAITAVNTIHPDICVAVDVTHGWTPDGPKDKTFQLGGGPAIGVGPNINRKLSQRLMTLAQEMGIEYQTEVMSGHSGTNAWPMQICGEGVATAIISLPLKYMHTPIEVVHRADLEATAQLLAAFAARPEEVAPHA